MATLPIEIFFHHIFLKLPVKSLSRFKCVCKEWNILLCDPKFVRMHLEHATQQHYSHKLLVNPSCYSEGFYSVDHQNIGSDGGDSVLAVTVPLPIKDHSIVWSVLGSFNGLVCVSILQDGVKSDVLLILWNPATKDIKVLPDPNIPVSIYDVLGFAYHSFDDDYKIVRIMHDLFSGMIDENPRIDIYSLKTNLWKSIQDGLIRRPKVFNRRQGCALNGSIYWLCYNSHWEEFTDCWIVCFDLKDVKLKELPVPQDWDWGRDLEVGFLELKVFGGCLGMYKHRYGEELVIWTMKKNNNNEDQWIKIMVIDASFILSGVPLPICFMKDGKILHQIIYRHIQTRRHLVLYDPKTKSSTDFHIYCSGGVSYAESTYNIGNICLDDTMYIESLVSPNFYGV